MLDNESETLKALHIILQNNNIDRVAWEDFSNLSKSCYNSYALRSVELHKKALIAINIIIAMPKNSNLHQRFNTKLSEKYNKQYLWYSYIVKILVMFLSEFENTNELNNTFNLSNTIQSQMKSKNLIEIENINDLI
ncbi:hypothetical protein [Senegalia sp. (in: firmicutes)]|uniref:hypothetical protein n=1 Tax=Senegalia sp. (in: firmicutes) TaxID=1924098 RepID=UPI003F94E097